jgi:putative spermidine/putrescine transport system permease protein
MGNRASALLTNIVVYAILFFALLPIIVLIINAFNSSAFFEFPPESFSLQWFEKFASSREYQAALRVSTVLALTAVSIALAVGIPAAFAIDRYSFRGKRALQGIILSPLMLPAIIWALALIQYYALLRVLGSFWGLALAHSVIVTPYIVQVVLSSLTYVEQDLELAAKSLGASPIRTFFEITLPLVLPGVIVGAAFGFMISFTDVVVAAFIAGTRNITFPVRIYVELRSEGLDPLAVATSALVIAIIVVLALVLEKTFRWSRFI